MNNSVDRYAISLFGMQSAISYALALALIITRNRWGDNSLLFSLGVVVLLIFGTTILLAVIVSQLMLRPKEVIIDEMIHLTYRHRGVVSKTFDSIEVLYVNNNALRSKYYRYTGGMVKFKDDKVGIEISYEIAVKIGNKYIEIFNKIPPVPDWIDKKG